VNRRDVIGLGAVAVAAGAAAWLLRPGEAPPPAPSAAAPMFPALPARLGAAARIELSRQGSALVLLRAGDSWTLPARDGYPARTERVRELLLGLGELRLVERLTADPAALPRLGLDDPSREGSTAALIRVLDGGGAPLAELITGRRRTRTQGNLPEAVYVRRPGEDQAWLAEGRLPADTDPQSWIDRELGTIPRDRVRAVLVRRGDQVLELARAGEADAPLRVLRSAELADAADPPALEEVAGAFEALSFLDVRREDAAGTGEAVGESVFTLTDGLGITVRTAREGDAVWVRLAAAGEDEAARLNSRWRGWAFQLGPWKEKAFAPGADDLRAAPPASARP